jgi:dihydropteroate synthase
MVTTYPLDALPEFLPTSLWLRPVGMTGRDDLGADAWTLAGSGLGFSSVELLARSGNGDVVAANVSLSQLDAWAAARGRAVADRVARQRAALTAPRAPWAGLALDRPRIMGVLNVTPDSMSDGGDFLAPEQAIAQGRAMMSAGADIIDIGGESTRPGAAPVSIDEEIRRIDPVIRGLAADGALISVDTRHARVMAAAMAAGARIVNDVTALAGDPESLAFVARTKAPVVLMHMQGEPRTMQQAPHYALASLDIADYLAARIERCVAADVTREAIVVDPGIGFGKSLEHNLEILARLSLFQALGSGVLLGLSRKSFISRLSGAATPKERLPGSLAGGLFGLAQGAQILRVHDVAETKQAVAAWQAMAAGA